MIRIPRLFFILAIFSSYGAIALFMPESQNPLLSESISLQKVINEFNDIHTSALDRIKSELGIPSDDCERYLSAFARAVERDRLFGAPTSTNSNARNANEPWIIGKIYEILIEYGVNPERVIIKKVATPDFQAQALQDLDEDGHILHTLEINPDWFATYSHDAQEGFIRHEIMHLINYDCLEENYILGLFDELGFEEENYRSAPCIINYRQQREIRADILAAYGHPAIAQEMQMFFEHCALKSEHYLPETWNTHPRDIIRAQKLATLQNQMDASVITTA